ncbi:MAG TPA: DUF5691 domain-containing protein, partial [Polyangiales bacterium]|nr:DUF5691 domain-containing protein [Polyangiales bacterium]
MSAAESNKTWSSVVSVAALGTSRVAHPFDTLWPDPSFALPGDTPETTLLRVAAASYLWRVCGSRVPPSSVAPPEAAPPVEEKLISEVAAWRMVRILNGDHRDLLLEWFGLAARSGKVLPPQWLPVVLDTLKPSELDEVAPVMGRRAIWLAARNPAWRLRDPSAMPSEELWANGTVAERVAALTALRAIDAGAARGWVERTWQVDPPEAREAFVRVMLSGISAADEAFLEAATRDKRKAVRLSAVECLARLPSSAHALRNLERVERLLALDPPGKTLLGKAKKRGLRVELPATLDEAAERDGIEESPPGRRGIGQRAWWLVQMVALVPPSHWTTRFECDAQVLIDAVADTDYAADLLSALSQAACRHADAPWIGALVKHALGSRRADSTWDEGGILQLICAVPLAGREPLLAQALESIDDATFPLALGLLNGSGVDWSPATTRRAFELLGA